MANGTNDCGRRRRLPVGILAVTAAVGMAACQTTLGGGSGKATGSAGAAGASGEAAELRKCTRPIGTAALITGDRSQHARADLPSPVPVVKLMMQQSGCFTVVARGRAASDALRQERALAGEGQLQSNADMGEAQMAAADFIIEPAVLFQDSNAGGAGAALGSLLGSVGAVIGGGLQSKQAQTMLTVTNVRTSVQEAAATGSAEKYDLGGVVGAFGGGVAGAGGAYQSTDIGKVVMAALLDSHNKLVDQMNAATPTAERESVTNWVTAARLNLRSGPNSGAPVVTTLPEGASVRPIGDKQGTWWEVRSQGKQGWVSSDYLTESN